MCALRICLAAALLVATSSAGQSRWAPYMIAMGSNQYLVHEAPQPRMQYDQQLQASNFGYNFGAHDGGDAGHDGHDGHEGHDGGSSHDFGGHDFGGHNFGGHGYGGHEGQTYPVHEHVEEENPEPIKHYKEVVVPLPKNVEFKINQPIIIPVPHPVPIHVPVPKAVVIPIIKEVSIPVEKSVPYKVEKTVHVPKFKDVPFEVVKHVIVTVEKPVPFKVPVYETIIHTKKGSHKI